MADNQATADEIQTAASEEEVETPITSDTENSDAPSEPTTPSTEPEISDIEEWEQQRAALESGEIVLNDDAVEDPDLDDVDDEADGVVQEEIEDEAETPVSEEPTEQPEAAESEATEEEEERLRQFRIRPTSKAEERAFELKKADPYLSLEDALNQAKDELGIASPKKPDDTQTTDETEINDETESPVTSKSIRQQLEEKRAEKYTALEDFDNSTAAKLEREIDQLNDQLRTVEFEESQKTANSEAEFDRIFTTAENNVLSQFPDAAIPDSTFAQRMSQIDEAWEEAGDQRFSAADKPEVIANIVAKELGVNPATAMPAQRQTTTAKQPVPQSKSLHQPRKSQAAPPIQPASGGNRTQTRTEDSLLDNLTDEESWDKMVAEMAS